MTRARKVLGRVVLFSSHVEEHEFRIVQLFRQPGRGDEKRLARRGREGRDVLPDALRGRGVDVDLLLVYETVAEELAPETLEAVRRADFITFTSASTVRHLAAAAGGSLPSGPRLASIGPATSAALREHRAEPHLEADPHTPDDLVDAVVRASSAAR